MLPGLLISSDLTILSRIRNFWIRRYQKVTVFFIGSNNIQEVNFILCINIFNLDPNPVFF